MYLPFDMSENNIRVKIVRQQNGKAKKNENLLLKKF